MKIKLSKSQWESIGQKTGWIKSAIFTWKEPSQREHWQTPEGPTDQGNAIGKWAGGWLKGSWKCPICKTMITKNLTQQIPYKLVEQHQQYCKE